MVIADDGHGSADQSETSSWTVVENSAPTNSTPPGISGITLVGGLLSCSTGSWSEADGDTISYAFKWSANGNIIARGNTPSIVLNSLQAHTTITCSVTADDSLGGITSIISSGVLVENTAPVFTGPPRVSGAPKTRNTLFLSDTGTSDTDGDSVHLTYQWKADGIDIPGETFASCRISKAMEGKNVTCTITANDGYGGTTIYTTPGVIITKSFPWLILLPGLADPQISK